MKEAYNSYSESEGENIITNSQKVDFLLKDKIFFSSYMNEDNKNVNENVIENDINLNVINLGSSIICPEEDCFRNAIISIEPISFDIKSDCGFHIKNMNILKYVESAGKEKEENECCSLCNKSYKDILDEKKTLYKCYCGHNICDTCKSEHLNGNDENEHNLIDFDKKDYICCCSKDFKKFLGFCVGCKKNICILCDNQHKGHPIKKFSELYKLGKDEKNKRKQILDEKKEDIEKIKKIIDDWMSKVKKFFEIYKKKLDLFWEINNLILNKYDLGKNYYEEIKNVENIHFDFDNKLLDLINSEEDFKKQNEIMFKMINEYFVDYNKNKNNKNNKNNEIKNTTKCKYQLDKSFENSYKVKNICELKKDKLLLVNVKMNKQDKQETLLVFSQSELNNYNQEPFIEHPIDEGHIINMFELKNGNVLILQNKYFKIAKVQKEKKTINIIQNQKQTEIFKQIIELINGNLASISYNPKAENYIIIWEKNLMSDEYEKKKTNPLKEVNDKPHYLMELNNNSILVYFEEENLIILNSKTNEIIKKLPKIKTINTNNPNYKVFKMIRINENILMFVYNNGFLLYNLLLNRFTKVYTLHYMINDISHIPNDNKSFFINYRESNTNRNSTVNSYGLIPVIYDEFLQKVELGHEILNIHSQDITCVKLLSNNYLVTSSLDNKMKMWKINKQN